MGKFNFSLKKQGFTIAETLITIGIIGIIASITIPGLINYRQKKVIETRLMKFYTTINQAIKLAEADYGESSGWEPLGDGFVTDEEGNETDIPVAQAWIEKYILPYIKADTKMTNKHGKIQIYFQDGSMVAVSRPSCLFYPAASKYNQAEDGVITQIEAAGKDMFIFLFVSTKRTDENGKIRQQYIKEGVVEPYIWAWDGTREGLFNGLYGCGKPDVVGAYCTELIRQNGWKIPKDYPIKL